MKDSAVYIYVGEGLGVPGLPHRITQAEAESLGCADLLKAAIENGSYKAEQSTPNPKLQTPNVDPPQRTKKVTEE